MSCEECKGNNVAHIPFVALEAECARHDRAVKRLLVVIVLVVVLLVASNLAWLYWWNQYDYVVEDSSVDLSTRNGGNANYIGQDGDINNYGIDPSTESHSIP
ncbi:MAG: hypothetical protein II517_04165 [Ruminococcus sp.]|nr:hypothetical protein [Ruminococcus sp.]